MPSHFTIMDKKSFSDTDGYRGPFPVPTQRAGLPANRRNPAGRLVAAFGLAVLFLLFGAVGFPRDGRSQQVQVDSVQVTVDIGNLRGEPQFGGATVGKVYRGARLQVLGRQGQWYRVRRENGAIAWAHESILEPVGEPDADPKDGKILEAVQVEHEADNQEKVVFLLSGFFPPETFALEGENPRVVCDFYGTRLGNRIDGPIAVNATFIREIRFGIYDDPTPKVRVVLDLVPGKDYAVQQFFFQESNRYTVILSEAP